MQAIREFHIAGGSTLTLKVPPEFSGQRLEVIMLPVQDDAAQEEIDALWAEEAERRIRELDDGIAQAIPGEEVFAKLRARFAE